MSRILELLVVIIKITNYQPEQKGEQGNPSIMTRLWAGRPAFDARQR